jgi:hypothetical protein
LSTLRSRFSSHLFFGGCLSVDNCCLRSTLSSVVVLVDRQGHRERVMGVGPVCVLARPTRYTLHKRLAGWSQRTFTRWLWFSNPWPCDELVLLRPRDFLEPLPRLCVIRSETQRHEARLRGCKSMRQAMTIVFNGSLFSKEVKTMIQLLRACST